MSNKPLFRLGLIAATPNALRLLEATNTNPLSLLQRHISGDDGELDEEDKQANKHAIKHGLRILSSYQVTQDAKVWIITEADRSITTILLPEDY